MDKGINFVGKCLLIGDEKKSKKIGHGERILVVGDLHLGYEEYLNRTGVFVSRVMFREMIEEFDRVFGRVGKIDRVVLLGDVKHDFGHVLKQEWNDVLGLFEYLLGKVREIVIVKGNHDSILEPIVRENKRVVLRDYFIWKGYCFVHGDRAFKEMYDRNVGVWVMGHGHPSVKLGDGVRVEKYRCFLEGRYQGRGIVIVPSFFQFSEGSDPRENNLRLAWDFELMKFRVWVVGENLKVLDFGKLGRL